MRGPALLFGASLLMTSPVLADPALGPQIFRQVTNAGQVVGTTAVQLLTTPATTRSYLDLHLPAGGIVGVTWDGSTPVIGAANTKTFIGVGGGQLWVAPSWVPQGAIKVVAQAAGTAVFLQAYPN